MFMDSYTNFCLEDLKTVTFQDIRALVGQEIEPPPQKKPILLNACYNVYGELGRMKTERQNKGAQNHWSLYNKCG